MTLLLLTTKHTYIANVFRLSCEVFVKRKSSLWPVACREKNKISNIQKHTMNPLLLQQQLKDNATNLEEFTKDLKSWSEEMKRKENSSISDKEVE